MSRYLAKLGVLAVACVIGSISAEAADIRVDPSLGSSGAVLEGKIEPGDFDKFRSFIFHGKKVVQIYLASPGGNLGEAMKIGLLIRLLRLSTVAPSEELTNEGLAAVSGLHNLKNPKADYMCASACFFMFVAGVHRSADSPGQVILGIHRPSLAKNVRIDFDQRVAIEDRTRVIVERYLKVMNVPAKYAEDMYSVPKGVIQWIRTDEFEADLDGFIPSFRVEADAQCDNHEAATVAGIAPNGDATAERTAATQLRTACIKKLQTTLALGGYTDAVQQANSSALQIFLANGPPRPAQASSHDGRSPTNLPIKPAHGPAFPTSQRGPAFPQPHLQ